MTRQAMRGQLAVCVSLLALTSALPVRGQTINGTLDFASSPPERVLLTLLNEDGRVVRSDVSAPDGSFHVDVGEEGDFRIRVERVGHRPVTSDVLRVRGSSTAVALEAPTREISLVFQADEYDLRCVRHPVGDDQLAEAWRQARTALRIAAWSQDAGQVVYDAVVHRRDLAPDGRTVVFEPEPREVQDAVRLTPRLDPSDVVGGGFVVDRGEEGYRFYMPDPSVLVSEAFLDSHCFRLRQDGGPALVGVAFEPMPGRSVPDVGGVLWLEAATGRLLVMEFGYRELDLPVDLASSGGRVVFHQLPDGTWITPERWLRSPMLEVREDEEGQRWVLSGLREEGVRVFRALSAGEAWAVAPQSATLEGSVLSAGGDEPLEGARVGLVGTEYKVETDELGRFRMGGLLEGSYRIVFQHPDIPGGDVPVEPVEVVLRRGEVNTVRLEAPSPEVVANRLCRQNQSDRSAVVLTGQVTDSITGEPLAGVPLSIRFRDPRRKERPYHDARISTGAGGEYLYCDAPPGETVRIRALTPGASDRDTSFVAVGRSNRTNLRVPLATDQGPGGVFGVVTAHESGKPIEAVEVSVEGTGLRTLTNPNGFFSFEAVPSGMHVIEFNHLAYQDREVVARLGGSHAFQMNVDLSIEAIPIEGIVVTAVPRRLFSDMVDLHHRMELGFGEFITRDEIQTRAGNLATLLQGMAGARVLTGGSAAHGRYVVLRRARQIGVDTAGVHIDRCFPAVYVDGQRYSKPTVGGIGHDPVDMSAFMSAELEAVEVYKGAASVPAMFGGGDAACGAVVVWTRRGGPVVRDATGGRNTRGEGGGAKPEGLW